jgi:hypothetical protein
MLHTQFSTVSNIPSMLHTQFSTVSVIPPMLHTRVSTVSVIPPMLHTQFSPVSIIPPMLHTQFSPVNIIAPMLYTQVSSVSIIPPMLHTQLSLVSIIPPMLCTQVSPVSTIPPTLCTYSFIYRLKPRNQLHGAVGKNSDLKGSVVYMKSQSAYLPLYTKLQTEDLKPCETPGHRYPRTQRNISAQLTCNMTCLKTSNLADIFFWIRVYVYLTFWLLTFACGTRHEELPHVGRIMVTNAKYIQLTTPQEHLFFIHS